MKQSEPECDFFPQTWPEDALEAVAYHQLEEIEMDDETRTGVINMCQYFHNSTIVSTITKL